MRRGVTAALFFSSKDQVSKLEFTKARKNIYKRQGTAGQVLNTGRFPPHCKSCKSSKWIYSAVSRKESWGFLPCGTFLERESWIDDLLQIVLCFAFLYRHVLNFCYILFTSPTSATPVSSLTLGHVVLRHLLNLRFSCWVVSSTVCSQC